MSKNDAIRIAVYSVFEVVRLNNGDFEIEDLLEAVRVLEDLRDPVEPLPERTEEQARVDSLVGEEMEMLAWCCR